MFLTNRTAKVRETFHFAALAALDSSEPKSAIGQVDSRGYCIDAIYGVQDNSNPSKTHDGGSANCTVDQQALIQKLTISDYQRTKSTCKAGCICRCHAPRRIKVFPPNRFLGSFSIVVSAASGNKSPCTETSCLRRSRSVTRATYRFPYWFLARIMCFTINMQPHTGFNACLKTLRVVPDDADVMRFAKTGDLEGVRSMMTRGLASPLDVNASWNVPILSVSTDP